MKSIILAVVLIPIFWSPLASQNDIIGPRTQQWTINLEFGSEFLAADSTELMPFSAGSVIKAVYWHTDTLTTGLDSLQLRLGSAQTIIHSYPVALEAMGLIRYNQTWYPLATDNRLRLHRYAGAPCTGQVRVTVEWIQLN